MSLSSRRMRRILRAILAALAGSTAGYVVHQLMARREEPAPEGEGAALVVGAPMLNTVLGTAAGLVAGPCAAFWTGFAVSAAVGARLDAEVPALAEFHVRVAEGGSAPESPDAGPDAP